MKKNKLLLLFLFFVGLAGFVSCKDNGGNEEPPVDEEIKYPVSELPQINMEETISNMKLYLITIDTSNAKTRFYLGEDFSSEGLVVTAYYKEDNDSDDALEEKVIVDKYAINTEFVNMGKTGKYRVYVTYRDGIQTAENVYYIQVGNSFFPESGVKYLAGIESDVKQIEFKQGEEFKLPAVSITAKYMIGTEVVEQKNVPAKALEIDSSSVDTSKKGTYLVKYSLKTKVEIEGKEYEITESTFILVRVINDVKGISFISGTTTQAATVKGLDCSDWKFKLDLELGDNQEIMYNPNDFKISGVNTLVAGVYNATINYFEDGKEVSTSVEVTITEPVGEKIVQCLEFGDAASITSRTRFGEGFYFYGGPNTTVEIKKGSSDGIEFPSRFKLNGAGSITNRFFEVYMPNKGTLVMYYETGSVGSERIMAMMDSTGSIIHSFATATTIAKEVIEIEEAGTYYFASQASGMNIWGCIISYETEGAVEPTPSTITNLEFVGGTTKFIQNGSKEGFNTWKLKATYDDNTSEVLDNTSSKISIAELDNTTTGNKQIVVTYDDGNSIANVTVDVVVTDVTLTKIEYVSGTTTQRSTFGSFNVTDFTFKATYSDASTKDLAAKDVIVEVDSLTIGNKVMNVTYVDEALQTATTTVNVIKTEMSADNKILNPTTIDASQIPNVTSGTQNVVINGFDLVFSDSGMTDGKSNTLLEDNKKTVNDLTFTKRLSLKAKGNTKHNVIKFTTTKANAKLVVYASSSQDTGKYLFISKDADAGTVYNDYKVLVTKTNQVFEFVLKDAGEYYVLADNAAYIFFMALEYDQLDTTSTATATSIEMFAPTLVDNTLTVEKTTESSNVFDDVYFAINYDNGGLALVKGNEVTLSTVVDTTVLGQTDVTITYKGLSMSLIVDVIEPAE